METGKLSDLVKGMDVVSVTKKEWVGNQEIS